MLDKAFKRFFFLIFLVGLFFSLVPITIWLVDHDWLEVRSIYEEIDVDPDGYEFGAALIERKKVLKWVEDISAIDKNEIIKEGYKSQISKECVESVVDLLEGEPADNKPQNSKHIAAVKKIRAQIAEHNFSRKVYTSPSSASPINFLVPKELSFVLKIDPDNCISEKRVYAVEDYTYWDSSLPYLMKKNILIPIGLLLIVLGSLFSILWPIWEKTLFRVWKWIKTGK